MGDEWRGGGGGGGGRLKLRCRRGWPCGDVRVGGVVCVAVAEPEHVAPTCAGEGGWGVGVQACILVVLPVVVV